MSYPIIFQKVTKKILDLYHKLEESRAMFGGVRGSSDLPVSVNEDEKMAIVKMVQKSLKFLDFQCDASRCIGNHNVMTEQVMLSKFY